MTEHQQRPARPSIFEPIPEEEWDDAADDDPGDVTPPGSLDVEIPEVRPPG